jgi:AraC-like DNA-binding protein
LTATHGNEEGKRTAAIMALLSEPTIEGAARKAGISDTTLYRLLKDESFTAEYRAARREALSHAVARLQADSSKAGKALLEIIENQKAPAMARVRAIEVLFDYAYKAIETEELAARLERLERLSKGQSEQWEGVNYGYESEATEADSVD